MNSIFSRAKPAPKPAPPAAEQPVQVAKVKLYTLEDLYNEVGTIQWHTNDRGWESAVDAFRKRIREMITENRRISQIQ